MTNFVLIILTSIWYIWIKFYDNLSFDNFDDCSNFLTLDEFLMTRYQTWSPKMWKVTSNPYSFLAFSFFGTGIIIIKVRKLNHGREIDHQRYFIWNFTYDKNLFTLDFHRIYHAVLWKTREHSPQDCYFQ